MQIVEWAKSHPIATGAIVIIGGIIFIVIVRGGSSGSSNTASGPSDTQIMADAQIKAAQIAASAQAAQAGAAVQAAQIGAGVQINSDNKAAEVYMAQIQAQKDLGMGLVQAEQAKADVVKSTLPLVKQKNRDDVLQAYLTGQLYHHQYDNNPGNSVGGILSGAGSAIKSLGSIFSDERLKENIRHIGYDKRGRDLYEFNYKGSSRKRIGHIAQAIERSEPDKVFHDKRTGYKRIDAIALN